MNERADRRARETVDTEMACGGRIRVRCPACRERAVVLPMESELRLTCMGCGYLRILGPWPANRKLHFPAAYEAVARHRLELWLVAECCGGHSLWALDEVHLEYMRRYVASTDRSSDFPSVPGRRQLADKFPAWLKAAKHREEVLRTIRRMADM